jgi:SAM-dependent methyltransferase
VTADPYAAIAALYDLEHAGFADDLDLYRGLARVVGDPILELGCGTGRLLVPLAAAGHRLTGLDRSAPMLDRARAEAAAAGVDSQITLHQGAMTEADRAPGGPFGLVIVALNGLLHVPTAAEQRRTLVAARRALDPRGQLVLDLLNPTPEALHGLDHGVTHEGTWRLSDGTRVDKFSARRVSPAAQRIDVDLWYDQITREGTLRRTATSLALRYLYPSELELLLELAGFVEWQRYGSYDLDPYGDGAERLIVTAEVSPSE